MKPFSYKQNPGEDHSEKLDGLWPHFKDMLMNVIGMGKKEPEPDMMGQHQDYMNQMGGDSMAALRRMQREQEGGQHTPMPKEAPVPPAQEGHPKLQMLMNKLSGNKTEQPEEDELKPNQKHGFGRLVGGKAKL